MCVTGPGRSTESVASQAVKRVAFGMAGSRVVIGDYVLEALTWM